MMRRLHVGHEQHVQNRGVGHKETVSSSFEYEVSVYRQSTVSPELLRLAAIENLKVHIVVELLEQGTEMLD